MALRPRRRGPLRTAALILLLLLVPLTSAGTGAVSIFDDALDPTVVVGRPSPLAISPNFGIPDPGVDFRELRLSASGDSLAVAWRVEDIDFAVAGRSADRTFTLGYASEMHARVIVGLAYFATADEWTGLVLCLTADSELECFETVDTITVDDQLNTVQVTVPFALVGDRVMGVRSHSQAFWVDQLGVVQVGSQDTMPDCTPTGCVGGPDFVR